MSLVNDMLRDLEARSERRVQNRTAGGSKPSSKDLPASRPKFASVALAVGITIALTIAVQKWVWPKFQSMPSENTQVVSTVNEVKELAEPAPFLSEVNGKITDINAVRTETEFVAVAPTFQSINELTADTLDEQTVVTATNTDVVNVADEAQQGNNGIVDNEQVPRSDSNKNTVEQHLLSAEQCFAVDRLTTPRNDNALAHYEIVLAMVPSNEQALAGVERIVKRYIELAEIAEHENNHIKVERYRLRAKQLADRYPHVEKSLANYFPNDQSSISRVPSMQFQDEKVVNQAQQSIRAGDIHRAITDLEQFIKVAEHHSASEKLLIDLYARVGRHEDALRQLSNSSSFDDAERLLRRSRIYIAEGQFELALKNLESSTPAIGSHQDYYALQAALLHQLGRYQDATTLYQRLLSVEKSQFTYWLGLAVSLDALNDWSAALQAFRRANQLGSADSDSMRYVKQRIQSLSEAS